MPGIHRLLLAPLIASAAISGCAESPPQRNGEWVGYAAIAGDRLLPIRATVNVDTTEPNGYFSVAGERTPIPEITVSDDSMEFRFAEYGAVMTGRLESDRFAGRYIRFREDTTSFPFVLFFNQPQNPLTAPDSSVAGTYRVIFGNGDEVDSSSIAVLDVAEGRLSGTVIHPSGDYGLLESAQGNGTLRLYRFTGWQALYFELTESEIGFRGRYQLRNEPPRDVAFIRTSDDARETDRITRMKNPDEPFLFSGLTSSGAIVTSQDSLFAGRPLVIDIMGTWCHNCLDAAPLLQQAYEDYRDAGLQVVSLAFEVPDEAAAGLKNLEIFRDRFGITYPVLYCGSLDEENVAARLKSQLENFFSYPTTIFVNRDGTVAEIHTGFNGPGTGERWEEQVAEFNDAVLRILES